MSETTFDIAFYGIIKPGKDKEVVIQNMAQLFKTSPEKVRPFFAGGRKVLKSKVDELTAEKYRAALENAGLVIKLESLQTQAPVDSDVGDSSVAPVGGDVRENTSAVRPQTIDDTSDLTLAEVGADVLDNPPVVEAQPIGDISDLTLAEVGADVLENPPAVEAQPIGDISDLTLAETGVDLIENPQPKEKAPVPNTSDLNFEDK